jgi:hypothetical protein
MSVVAEETVVDEVEQEQIEQEQEPDGETPEGEPKQESESDPEELVVSIGDASPASEEEELKQAPEWVKELRKENREKARKLKELEAKLAEREAQSAPQVTIPKPTLEGCDYDTEVFEQKFMAWQQQEATKREAERKKQDEEKAHVDAWNAKIAAYNEAKAKLKVPDFDDAEAVVLHEFNETQQGIIVSGAENAALVNYAIGKNPAKAKELASIKDPIKFAFAVARLETQVKTSPRKAPPAPEGRVRGNAAPSGAVDNTLERLREKAEKTGDMSEVIAYKAKLRAAK